MMGPVRWVLNWSHWLQGHWFLLKHGFHAIWSCEFWEQCLKAGDFLCAGHLHIICFHQYMGLCWHKREGTVLRKCLSHRWLSRKYKTYQLHFCCTANIWYSNWSCCAGRKTLKTPYWDCALFWGTLSSFCLQLYADTKKLVKTSDYKGKGYIDLWWRLLCWQHSRCWLNIVSFDLVMMLLIRGSNTKKYRIT